MAAIASAVPTLIFKRNGLIIKDIYCESSDGVGVDLDWGSFISNRVVGSETGVCFYIPVF